MSSGVILEKPEITDATSIVVERHGDRVPEWKLGTVKSIVQFNHRIAPSGTRFYYASIEADVLGMVLNGAVNKSASDICARKCGSRSSAEADASWLIDQKDLNWGTSASMPFCAITPGSGACWRMTAHGMAGRSLRRNG